MYTRTTTVKESWTKTKAGQVWTAKNIATARRLARKGFSAKQIAVLLRRSEKAVYVKMNELGI
jgi:DNA-binding NarL/FixJ family response regulator